MNMARKDTLATPCIFLRERLFRVEEKKVHVRGPGGGVKKRKKKDKESPTYSLSSSYMGRMEGWHTKAKVRMGTAYTVCGERDEAFRTGP